jgi:hypothetical protein
MLSGDNGIASDHNGMLSGDNGIVWTCNGIVSGHNGMLSSCNGFAGSCDRAFCGGCVGDRCVKIQIGNNDFGQSVTRFGDKTEIASAMFLNLQFKAILIKLGWND